VQGLEEQFNLSLDLVELFERDPDLKREVDQYVKKALQERWSDSWFIESIPPNVYPCHVSGAGHFFSLCRVERKSIIYK